MIRLRLLLFFFYCYGDHRDLHSFPTRRSSDLRSSSSFWIVSRSTSSCDCEMLRANCSFDSLDRFISARATSRSEEHTSELQSRLHLVCRLLLEKKKKKKTRSLVTKYSTPDNRA